MDAIVHPNVSPRHPCSITKRTGSRRQRLQTVAPSYLRTDPNRPPTHQRYSSPCHRLIPVPSPQMSLAVGIAFASCTQVALFVVPVTVLAGWLMGVKMDLSFHPFEAWRWGSRVGQGQPRRWQQRQGGLSPSPLQAAAPAMLLRGHVLQDTQHEWNPKWGYGSPLATYVFARFGIPSLVQITIPKQMSTDRGVFPLPDVDAVPQCTPNAHARTHAHARAFHLWFQVVVIHMSLLIVAELMRGGTGSWLQVCHRQMGKIHRV